MKSFMRLGIVLVLGISSATCFARQKESFYGAWIVDGAIANGAVTALTTSEERRLIGRKVVYSSKILLSGKRKIIPHYRKRRLSYRGFFEVWNSKLDSIGIKRNSVVQVDVYTDSRYENLWTGFGGTLFIKDKDTIVVVYAGEFFTLKRRKHDQ